MTRILLALLLASCAGCGPATQQQSAATVEPAINLTACILTHVVSCATAKPQTPWPTCTAQTATACGTDVAAVVSIWADHKMAMAREGAPGVQYP